MKLPFKLFIGITLFTTVLFSQNQAENKDLTNTENQSKQNFNELKLNWLFLIFGSLEIAYERTLSDESAIGISGYYAIDKDFNALNYYISPYYRFYFGKKYAQGLFVEGFAMLNSYDNETFLYDDGFFDEILTEEKTDFALGVGLGGKWVMKKGFISEVGVGVGRNYFNSNDTRFRLVGKAVVALGYRF